MMMKTVTAAVAAALVLAASGPAMAMSGGRAVLDDGWAPWVATLAPRIDAPLLQRAGCGGALIAPDRVLTAAHCVDRVDPSQTEVHIGARVLSQQAGQVRGIRGVSVLPGYELLASPVDPGDVNLSSAKNDVALILLDRPVTSVPPVAFSAYQGTTVQLLAHGTTAPGDPAGFRNDVLYEGFLTVLDAQACAAGTPAIVDRHSVGCAQGEGVTGCFLDSGSPVVRRVDGVTQLVGLFSFGGETAGKQCGEPSPAYFADVTSLRRWAFQPHPLLQPYPAGPALVVGEPQVGAVLECRPPSWDRQRGLPPSNVVFQWATVLRFGPFVIPVELAGQTRPRLAVTADLRGQELACLVIASNFGGTTQVSSESATIADAPAETAAR